MRSIPMRTVNQLTEQDTRYQLNSPLLFGALTELSQDSRIDVLDLAPASPELVEFFSAYHCNLMLPGCQQELLLARTATEPDEAETGPDFPSLIPHTGKTQKAIDLLLMWDLPNYLDRQSLRGLIQHLLPAINQHSILHIYIHTRQHMPVQPADYRILGNQRILVDMHTPWTQDCPMYYQELLHRLLDPFRVKRGMLLANGLQEYILQIDRAYRQS